MADIVTGPGSAVAKAARDRAEEEGLGLAEKRVASEEIFRGRMLHIFNDTVELPNGMPASREVIRHVGAVAVLPLTGDGQAVVERQFRYPVGKVITEIPAGKLNSSDEDRLEAAKRELREETGITADEWTDMGEFIPAAAYCDEKLTLYLARGLHYGPRDLDDDEFLNVETVPFGELVDDVMNGRIVDAKTQTAVLKAACLTGYFAKGSGDGR